MDPFEKQSKRTGFSEDWEDTIPMKANGIISDLFFNQDNDAWSIWLGPRDPKFIIDFIFAMNERIRKAGQ